MSVFNCTTYETDEINETVDFKVETQTDDLDTGEISVTDSLKIKGVNGVNVAVHGDTILIGVDGTGGSNGLDGSSCTCPAFYTADSVEELPDPATVPKNSIGLVPSKNEDSGDTGGDSGGDTGGDSGSESSGAVLPVVDLTTTITMCSSSITSAVTTLNNTDQAAIDAAADTGLPVLIKAKSDAGLDFSVIGNNTGGSYFECGYCLTFAKAVVAYDGGTKKWEFRLTYVGS